MIITKQEIKDLLGDSSRIQADIAVETICNNPESFENLIDLMLEDNGQMSMRVSRVVEICESYYPDLFKPYSKKVLTKLPECKTPGLKRAILKIYTRRDLPYNQETIGNIIELCFSWLKNPYEPIGVRVLCMMVLEKIALKEQWLIPELIFSIEDLVEKEDVHGIKLQSKKTLKKLHKLML